MAAPECGGSKGYRDLRYVSIELNSEMVRGGGEGFAVCFWLYLSSSGRPYSVILHQIAAGDDNKLPFLALGEGNKLLLFPLRRLDREAPISPSSYPWTDTTNLSAIIEGPLEKWFHIGCEVTEKAMRLHIDGNLITGAHLCSLSNEPDHQDGANLISLVGSDDKLEGYVYNIQVSHILGTIQEHYAKNPPFKLSIDFSYCDGIEEGEDGIWNIVGGKVLTLLDWRARQASTKLTFLLLLTKVRSFFLFSAVPIKDASGRSKSMRAGHRSEIHRLRAPIEDILFYGEENVLNVERNRFRKL